MKTTAHNHLRSILTQRGTPLQKIFAAYEAHQQIEVQFKKDLPDVYQTEVKLLRYTTGVMTLGVKNAALFSRLNYTKDNLMSHFKQMPFWTSLREIKIKILT